MVQDQAKRRFAQAVVRDRAKAREGLRLELVLRKLVTKQEGLIFIVVRGTNHPITSSNDSVVREPHDGAPSLWTTQPIPSAAGQHPRRGRNA